MKFVMPIAFAMACSSPSASDAPPPAPSPSSPSTVAKPPPPDLQIVSTGDPKTARLLRYRLAKGTQSRVELRMAITAARPMPTVVQTLAIDVVDVAGDGNATVDTTIERMQFIVDDNLTKEAPMFGEMARAITGLAFRAVLSPDGKVAGTSVKNDGKLPPPIRSQLGQLTQGIEQVAMPLPDKPVGLGAKWTSRKVVKQVGIEMVTVTTTEITAFDGDRISFKSTSTVTAPDQGTKFEGEQVEMNDIGGGGVASGTVDLARMTMIGTFELEFRGTLIALGRSTPMKTKMSLTMTAPDPASESASGSSSGSAGSAKRTP
jgi:hypothetical protein